jgi:hypothetical protein
MLSLVALPVEIQLEIFTRCTYASLKQLQVRAPRRRADMVLLPGQ